MPIGTGNVLVYWEDDDGSIHVRDLFVFSNLDKQDWHRIYNDWKQYYHAAGRDDEFAGGWFMAPGNGTGTTILTEEERCQH